MIHSWRRGFLVEFRFKETLMGRKKVLGFTFVQFKGDHPPPHVHIYDAKGRSIGRWDIEHQQPMDDFEVSRKLRKALKRAGYLKEE